MDKQQNKKKRRSRGDGVTSYRVTSSLTLTDEAYQHQQRAKQQRAMQPDPYAQQGYGQAQAAYSTDGSYDQGQGYYDQQGQQSYDPNQPYDPNQSYDQQGYYDPNQQGYYDQSQQGYDPNQPYDPNQAYDQSQTYDQGQGYYDQGQGYDSNQAYTQDQNYDPNQPYDQSQGYYDPNQQGYYDPNQPYDPNQAYDQSQSYDQQAYYDQGQQGYYDPNQQAYYDQSQQGYYDQGQQGYYEQEQQGYYPQAGEAPAALPPRKRKIESVMDYYSQMLGEGHTYATDSDDSPHHESVRQENAFYQNQYQQMQPYPPPHLVPASPAVQLLGPFADLFFKLQGYWQLISQKVTYYTDMLLDLQESIQKEFKEAAGQAFKGFVAQLRQRSPIALPYQQPQGATAAAQAGLPPGYQPYGQGGQQPPVSFVDLHELNVEFTDNYDQPLFDFSKYAGSQYKVSKQIADPAAYETALWAIRECASRAGAIPPAQEGPYANLPLTEVMNNVTENDLQAFLRYVKAYPGNYVSRSLKVSETFATWVVYGAPQP